MSRVNVVAEFSFIVKMPLETLSMNLNSYLYFGRIFRDITEENDMQKNERKICTISPEFTYLLT